MVIVIVFKWALIAFVKFTELSEFINSASQSIKTLLFSFNFVKRTEENA